MISENDHDRLVAEMLGRWRTEAGYTQVEMARLIGCSRSELQQIEYGNLRVKSYTIVKWANITGHDPVLCMQQILNPSTSFSGSALDQKRERLSASLNICAEDELDALTEILLEDHGGSRRAIIHLISAYVQLDPGDKQNITLLITNCFRLLLRRIKPRFTPDLELIDMVREKAADAHIKGEKKYL